MKATCVYCSRSTDRTKDHIPPKALFPASRRNVNLITVPACNSCNSQFSKDDTYFRDMLCMRQELSGNPAVQELLPVVVRSITGPKRERYLNYINSRFAEHEAVTESGENLGMQPTLKVDQTRTHSTLQRIVKGLFFNLKGQPLPQEYEVRTFTMEYVDSLNSEQLRQFTAAVIAPLEQSMLEAVGERIFGYRRSDSSDDFNSTAWHLVFYEKYFAYAVTLKRGALPPMNFKDHNYPPKWVTA
jgi:hypothetical protein